MKWREAQRSKEDAEFFDSLFGDPSIAPLAPQPSAQVEDMREGSSVATGLQQLGVDPRQPTSINGLVPRYKPPKVITADELRQFLPPVPARGRQVDHGMGPNVRPHMDFGRPTANGLLSNVKSNAAQLQKLAPGLRMTSGYRDPQHNAAVGGVKNSFHVQGRAVDFSGSAKAMAQGAAVARQLGAREVLIHSVHKGGGVHLHVAW